MSRIGNAEISLPNGVEINVSDSNFVTVKGKLGELTQQFDRDLKIKMEDGRVTVSRPTEQKRHKASHGLFRSLLANMVSGVSNGFVKELELVGVGYRVSNKGNLIEMNVGYSHPIMFYVPDDLKVSTETVKGRPPVIKLEGIDNQLLGQVASKIRSYRKPEPYKGKGIKYKGEVLRRKAGKTAG